MIPVAGSAYTYGYATLGEIFAWIIGWDLVLEYAFGAATVCSGWSGYVLSLGQDFGLRLPPELAGTPGSTFVLWNGHWEFLGRVSGKLAQLDIDPATLPQRHGVFNLIAFLGIMMVTTILVVGMKESANFNSVIVVVKLVVLCDLSLRWAEPYAVASSGAAASELASVSSAEYGDIWVVWMVGRAARGGCDLLCVHRVRCGVDGGAGGEEPEAGYADRHSWFAGHLHDSVHPGGAGADGLVNYQLPRRAGFAGGGN